MPRRIFRSEFPQPVLSTFKDVSEVITFEMLDAKLGSHAPFLVSISDGLQEELRITIAGAAAGEPGSNIPDFEGMDVTTKLTLSEILSKTCPIEVNKDCLYEICFHDYIIYQVRKESFSSYDTEAVSCGRYLITFEKSEFLSYLHTVTDACRFDDGSYYPGRWAHYGIYTQNHIIDVIAHGEPDISEVRKDGISAFN